MEKFCLICELKTFSCQYKALHTFFFFFFKQREYRGQMSKIKARVHWCSNCRQFSGNYVATQRTQIFVLCSTISRASYREVSPLKEASLFRANLVKTSSSFSSIPSVFPPSLRPFSPLPQFRRPSMTQFGPSARERAREAGMF